MEETLKWNISLYMVFVDFEKAFDSIQYAMEDFESLRGFREDFQVDSGFGFQARVLHEGDVTELFDMKTGVRQGCSRSPLLFKISFRFLRNETNLF